MCDLKTQEDEGPEEGEIQDDDDEEETSVYLSSSSSSYDRDIRNHERQRAARKYLPHDSSGSLSMSIVNDKMLSRTNHDRKEKSRVRPKQPESTHHKTSAQARSGLTHGKENRRVHQSREKRSPPVHHSGRPKSRSSNRSPHSRDHSKSTSKSHRSGPENPPSRSSDAANRDCAAHRTKKRPRHRDSTHKREATAEVMRTQAKKVKVSHYIENGEEIDDADSTALDIVGASEENCLKRKLLTMGALPDQSQSVNAVVIVALNERVVEEVPDNLTETESVHSPAIELAPEESNELVSVAGKDSGDVDNGVIFVAALPKPIPEVVTLSDSDAEQDTNIEEENVDNTKGATDMEMSHSSASSNADMDLEMTLDVPLSQPQASIQQFEQDEDDILSLRRAALMSKNKPTKDPATNAEQDDDDLLLRVAALRSAVLRKAEVRKKRRLQTAVGQVLGDETTPVDMDLADTDDEEDSVISQSQTSPEPPPLPMPPLPSDSLLKTVSAMPPPGSYFSDPLIPVPPPCHYMQTSFMEPALRDNLCANNVRFPIDPPPPRSFSVLPASRENVLEMDEGPHPGFPVHPGEFPAQAQPVEFTPHPSPMEFPVLHPVPPPLEYPGLSLEYPPPVVPSVAVDYPVQPNPSIDFDPAVPTPYQGSFPETSEPPPTTFNSELWNQDVAQSSQEPLSSILTKAMMKKKIQNTRPNLREIQVSHTLMNNKHESGTAELELSSMLVLDEVADSPVPSPADVSADTEKTEIPPESAQRQSSIDEDESFLREKLLKAISEKRETCKTQENVTSEQTSSKPDCSVAQPDCSVAQPDGSVAQSDGSVAKPDGSVAKPDGSVAQPDGSVAQPDGSVAQPDGSVAKPDGSIAKPDCSVAQPDGSVAKPDGSVAKPDGCVAKPDGCVAKPDGSVAKPDGSVAKPDDSVAEPDKSAGKPGANLQSKTREPKMKPQLKNGTIKAREVVLSKERLVYSKTDAVKVQMPRNTYPMRKVDGMKQKPKAVQAPFQLIIQLGEDSDSSDGLEDSVEAEDVNALRREPSMYRMKDYYPQTGFGEMEKAPEDTNLTQSGAAPGRSEVDLSKEVDKFLKDVRSSHESSANHNIAQPESPTISQVAVLKPVHVTPLAIRHLPASTQEEYHKLQQIIAEKELQKKALKKLSTAVLTQPKMTSNKKATSNQSAQPFGKVIQQNSIVSKPIATGAQPIEKVAQPIAKVAQPIVKAAPPIVTTSQPIVTSAQPIAMAAQKQPTKVQTVPSPRSSPKPSNARSVPPLKSPGTPSKVTGALVTSPRQSTPVLRTASSGLEGAARSSTSSCLDHSTPHFAPTKTLFPNPYSGTLVTKTNPDFFLGVPTIYGQCAPDNVVPGSAPLVPTRGNGQPMMLNQMLTQPRASACSISPAPASSVPVPTAPVPLTTVPVTQEVPVKKLEEAEMNLLKERSAVVGQIMGLTRLQNETENSMTALDVCENNLLRIIAEFDAACKEWQKRSNDVQLMMQSVKEKREQLRGSYVRTDGLAKSCRYIGAQVKGAAYTLPAGSIMQSKQRQANQQYGRLLKWRKAEQRRMRGAINKTDTISAFLKSTCQESLATAVNRSTISDNPPSFFDNPRVVPLNFSTLSHNQLTVPISPPAISVRSSVIAVSSSAKSVIPPAMSASSSVMSASPSTMSIPAVLESPPPITITALAAFEKVNSLVAPAPVRPESPQVADPREEDICENKNTPSVYCARRIVRIAKKRLREGGKPRELAKQLPKKVLGADDDLTVERKKRTVLTSYQSPLDHLENSSSHDVSFDPEAIMCPYELNGKCEDDECVFQHPVKRFNREKADSLQTNT